MKKVLTILAALAVSLTFAQAADPDKKADKKGNPEEHFKKLDTNGDGAISLDEMKASPMGQKDAVKTEERFKKMDKDSDGKVSLAEFSAGGGKKKDAGNAPKPSDSTPGAPGAAATTTK